MTKKPARAYHHGDLRGALVTAGRAILEEEGAAALTLRACARRAGVSHAAPKHHFESAADLLADIAASGFEDFVMALDRSAQQAQTPAARLQSMARAYVGFARVNPAIYNLMFGTRLAASSERLQNAMFSAWNQLADGVSAVAGSSHANAKATHVWSLVHGFSMLDLLNRLPPQVDRDDALARMLDSLPAAISSPA